MGRKIVASRTFYYDEDELIQGFRDINNEPNLEMSDEEVLDLVQVLAYEDINRVTTEVFFMEEGGLYELVQD
jgi:hypothetical protein